MEFDLEGEHEERAYTILAGLVVPRPIALVTTVDLEGRVNAAPFSFFNVIGDDPPAVVLAPGNRGAGGAEGHGAERAADWGVCGSSD